LNNSGLEQNPTLDDCFSLDGAARALQSPLIGPRYRVFAYYEWIVIKMIDHFSSGYVQEYLLSKWMSGTVAGKLVALIQECGLSDSHLRGELETEADRFLKLVDVRNKLIHAHPYTAASGDQQLLHHRPPSYIQWDPGVIRTAIQDFEEGAIKLNDLFWKLKQAGGLKNARRVSRKDDCLCERENEVFQALRDAAPEFLSPGVGGLLVPYARLRRSPG
jgi:hypothetical protein